MANSRVIQQICDAISQNSFSRDIKQKLRKYKSFDHENHLNNFQFKEGLLYFKDLFYVPNGSLCLQVLKARHDLSSLGLFGFNKTIELIFHDI